MATDDWVFTIMREQRPETYKCIIQKAMLDIIDVAFTDRRVKILDRRSQQQQQLTIYLTYDMYLLHVVAGLAAVAGNKVLGRDGDPRSIYLGNNQYLMLSCDAPKVEQEPAWEELKSKKGGK